MLNDARDDDAENDDADDDDDENDDDAIHLFKFCLQHRER